MDKSVNHPQPKIVDLRRKYSVGLLLLLLIYSFFCFYKDSAKNYSIFARTWGFDHLAFYNSKIILLAYVVVLAVIFPVTNSYILKFFQKLVSRINTGGKKKYFLFAGISILSFFLFYLLGVKYCFLGDFNLRMEQTMKKDFLMTEYLTMKLQYYFAAFGYEKGYTYSRMFVLYSCLCGGIFMYVSCLIADLLGKGKLLKFFYLSAQVASAAVLVFCGYIEVYATPLLCLSIFILTGLWYLRTGKRFYLVVITLLVAVGAHLLNLAVIPAVIVLVYHRHRDTVKFITVLKNKHIFIFVSLLILVACSIALNIKSGFLLPIKAPRTTPDYMTLLSVRHFWEFINGMVLCCGLSFVFLFVFFYRAIKRETPLSATVYFLLTLGGTFTILLFFANLQRGSGDWDIMAFSAVPLNLLVLALAIDLFKENERMRNYIMVAILLINGLHAFLWVHINHTDLSIRKIEKMLVGDPGTYYATRIPGIVQLAILYNLNNLHDETERAGEMACAAMRDKDLLACVMYAGHLVKHKKTEKAKELYEELLTLSPLIPEAYIYLMEYYEKKKDAPKVISYLNGLFDAFLLSPKVFLDNVNVRAEMYLALFEGLYQLEIPKNNFKRKDSIFLTIQKLRKIVAESKKN